MIHYLPPTFTKVTRPYGFRPCCKSSSAMAVAHRRHFQCFTTFDPECTAHARSGSDVTQTRVSVFPCFSSVFSPSRRNPGNEVPWCIHVTPHPSISHSSCLHHDLSAHGTTTFDFWIGRTHDAGRWLDVRSSTFPSTTHNDTCSQKRSNMRSAARRSPEASTPPGLLPLRAPPEAAFTRALSRANAMLIMLRWRNKRYEVAAGGPIVWPCKSDFPTNGPPISFYVQESLVIHTDPRR